MITYRELRLPSGLVALVDEADYQTVVAAGPWHAAPCGRHIYVQRSIRNPGTTRSTEERLHRFLTGWTLVDHRNGNGLDNRRSNLREATHAQNSANSRLSRRSTSGYKGVTWYKRTSRWRAHITAGQVQHHLGYFDSAEEAARAYDTAAIEAFGDFAHLNFPKETYL
ncbi:AP2 domain-containing protein [Streptomyces reticuli]|uniref:AP2 domain-containing protein n=1 Tax=Streptomyces reticuli TaxID=1926 RepID=UPI00073DF667|nr:Fis family transcriptional regulator [Streptomyces sp. SID7810]CUW31722.1 AP2 domain protein [Streptomyces reticuli]